MADARILVVAAHPDDEVLGCGATIARHVSDGAEVHVLLVADGEGARTGGDQGARADAARSAALVLGALPPVLLGLPDQRLDRIAFLDLVQAIEAVVAEVKAAVVYTHHGGDLNLDHRLVHRAVLTACRPLPGAPVTDILAFEVPSATEWGNLPFQPNHFVEVAAQMPMKMAALAAYDREMRPFPHARSREAVEGLALMRGAACGVRAAEAFMVLRQLRRATA